MGDTVAQSTFTLAFQDSGQEKLTSFLLFFSTPNFKEDSGVVTVKVDDSVPLFSDEQATSKKMLDIASTRLILAFI